MATQMEQPNFNYSLEDEGKDPLSEYLDIDISKMTAEELQTHLSKLTELTTQPRALKAILDKKPKKPKLDLLKEFDL